MSASDSVKLRLIIDVAVSRDVWSEAYGSDETDEQIAGHVAEFSDDVIKRQFEKRGLRADVRTAHHRTI